MVIITTGLHRRHALWLVVWGTRCGSGHVIIHLPNMEGKTVPNMVNTGTLDLAAWSLVQVSYRIVWFIFSFLEVNISPGLEKGGLLVHEERLPWQENWEIFSILHTYVAGENLRNVSITFLYLSFEIVKCCSMLKFGVMYGEIFHCFYALLRNIWKI